MTTSPSEASLCALPDLQYKEMAATSSPCMIEDFQETHCDIVKRLSLINISSTIFSN